MIPRTGTFAEVVVGTYVRDMHGVDWLVVDEREGWLLYKSRGGQRFSVPRPSDDRGITILEPSDAEAVRVVEEILPVAETVTQLEGESVWRTKTVFPPVSERRKRPWDQAREHLMMLHNIYTTDVKERAKLIEIHDEDHAHPGRGYNHHLHPGSNA